MLRFISRILMITTFFIGLGAITDTILHINQTTSETCNFNNEAKDLRQIQVIKLEKLEGLPKINMNKPSENKKIVVFRNF